MNINYKKLIWDFVTRFRMLRKRQLPAWRHYRSVLRDIKFNATPKHQRCDKNLLLLAWEFPPQVSGGVYRPTSFARYAAETGWNVTVLTGPAPEAITDAGQYLAQSIPESVTISRISKTDAGPHPWLLPDIDGGIMNAISVYEATSKIIHPGQTGIILASGPPFHSFVAGMWLAKRFGWQLALDYRDEWTQCPFDFVKKDTTNQKMEKQCLSAADHVVFTTQSQINHQTQIFSELPEIKCSLVTNGWQPDDFAIANDEPQKLPSNEAAITIAYLGNLGPMASPTDFLETLSTTLQNSPSLKNKLKVKLIGKKRPSVIEQLNDFPFQEAIEQIEHVPKTEACQIMQQLDALIILNPPTIGRYIQGKLYEYIASGTPILVFGEGGEMAAIVEELQAGVIVPSGDNKALEEALTQIHTHARSTNEKTKSWLKSRQREKLGHHMLDILDQLRDNEN